MLSIDKELNMGLSGPLTDRKLIDIEKYRFKSACAGWVGTFRRCISPFCTVHVPRIHSSLTAVHCSDDGYVEGQPVAWKE